MDSFSEKLSEVSITTKSKQIQSLSMEFLIDLPSSEYEHPFDKGALQKLRSLKGFDTVVNFFVNWGYVRWAMVQLQGSNFKVTHESCPELYNLARESAKALDVRDFPEIYTQWDYCINGCTTGYQDRTLMVLNTGAVDLLEPNQLKFVIGHEMGHIKSGHVIYHMMAELFTSFIDLVPMGNALMGPIQLGLMYWQRMSEFTADRAGLLACQDKDAAVDAIIKMAGVPLKYFDSLDHKAFKKQAEEFERLNGGVADAALKAISIMSASHPWTVYRAGELLKWIDSGEYDRIIEKYRGVPCRHCGNIVAKNATYCHMHGGHPFE